ncbi:hypothetical protein Tco_0741567 [Tanacetum coccineum]
MFEKIRLIRSEKERLEVRRNVGSRKTVRSETTIRSEKTIKKEMNRLEVKRPFEVRKEVYEKVDDIDSDIFSTVEVTNMMKELGYENPCMAYYYKKPNKDLDNGLTELVVDKDVCEMPMYKFKVIELYTNHSVNNKHVFIEEPLVFGTSNEHNEHDIGSVSEADVDVSEDEWLKEALKKLPIKSKKGEQPSRNEVGQSSRNGSGSENGSSSDNGSGSGSDSEDSDYFVDEENLIDDLEVDMADFKSRTDADAEWVGCKETVVEENDVFELEEVDHEDFDSESDSDEGVRRKALRKVARMHKAKVGKGETIWKENFFVGEQFATSKLVKEKVTRVLVKQRRQLWLKKNDKLRVRVVCRGQVPDFALNNMGTVVPVTCDPKGPTSKVQPKFMSKKKTKPIEYYGCPWDMQVSKLPNEDTWEVKTLEYDHKCLQSRIVKKCPDTFLSREVEESIKPNPKISLSALKDQL